MAKGHLVVLSGFSGAGKGTILKELLKRYDDYCVSISATTRSPRPGEVDGKDYFFISKEEFEKGIKEGNFLEYNNYVGNYYGTPKKWVFDQVNAGKNVIFEIEMNGGLNIKKVYPDVKLVFVTAPNMDELKKRLIGRGTESPEVISARLEMAEKEKAFMKDYDYILVNDDLNRAVEELDKIIRG